MCFEQGHSNAIEACSLAITVSSARGVWKPLHVKSTKQGQEQVLHGDLRCSARSREVVIEVSRHDHEISWGGLKAQQGVQNRRLIRGRKV